MTTILAHLRRGFNGLPRLSSRRPLRPTRWIEALENRTLLSAAPVLTFPFPAGVTPNVFIVTTTANPTDDQLQNDLDGNLQFKFDSTYGTNVNVAFNVDGTPISLYEAGSYADQKPSANGDDIFFDVPGKGPFVFNLPFDPGYPGVALTSANLSINGWTQSNLPGHKATSQALVNTSVTGDDAKIMIQINDRFAVQGNNDSILGVSVPGIDIGSFLGAGGVDIAGNFIGITPSGASLNAIQEGVAIGASPNGSYGSNNSLIGGIELGDRNFIADHTDTSLVGGENVGNGVGIYAGSHGNTVFNNLIQGNLYGIHFDASATSDNAIGGDAINEGNIITGNTQVGIFAEGGSGNIWAGNSIFENGAATAQAPRGGIILTNGANHDISAPVLESYNAATGIISGIVPGASGTASYVLDFYTNEDRDGSGHFEGETPFMSVIVTPDAQGNFTAPLPAPSDALTATVTDANDDASQFSNALEFSLNATPGPTVRPVEGETLSNIDIGTFTDSNPNANLRATVDWGDGSPASVLTGAASADGQLFPLGNHVFTIRGNHKYEEDGPYDMHVVIEDLDSQANTGLITHVEVAEADLTPVPEALEAVEGFPLHGEIGAFTDLDSTDGSSAYTATIDWGDHATSPGLVVQDSPGHFHVEGTHVYASADPNGQITITVTETGVDPVPSIEIVSDVDIADAPLHLEPNAIIHHFTGVKFTDTIATFTDEDPGRRVTLYTATIDWGDGTKVTLTSTPSPNGEIVPDNTDATRFDIVGTHLYKTENFPGFPVSVKVADDDGATDSGTTTAQIDDPPIAPMAVTFKPVEGKAFKGSVAQFTDPNFFAKATDFTATINWGDGTPTTPGTISAVKGAGFSVSGTHTYQHSGTHEVDVTLLDLAAQAQTTIPSTAMISDAPLKISTKAFKAVEGATFSGIPATFTDGNPFAAAADFTATIDWGDGNTTSASGIAGTITLTGKKFNVLGTHKYAEEGAYNVTVTVNDVGGTTVVGKLKATIADAPLTGIPVTFNATTGAAFAGIVASFTDPGTDGTADDYTATITWGDGHVTTAVAADFTMETVDGHIVFHLTGRNTYAKAGTFKVKVVIKDVGKSTATVQSKAVVT